MVLVCYWEGFLNSYLTAYTTFTFTFQSVAQHYGVSWGSRWGELPSAVWERQYQTSSLIVPWVCYSELLGQALGRSAASGQTKVVKPVAQAIWRLTGDGERRQRNSFDKEGGNSPLRNVSGQE